MSPPSEPADDRPAVEPGPTTEPQDTSRPIGVGGRGRPAVGWTEIALGIVTYLVVLFGLAQGVDLLTGTERTPPLLVISISALSAIVAVAVAVAVRVRALAALGLRRTTGRYLLLGVGGGVLAWLVSRFVIIYYVMLTGDGSNPQQGLADTATGSAPELLGLFLIGALVVPLAEELLFRGVIFGGLRRYGLVPAVAVSAVLFGIGHGPNVVGIAAIGLGVINALLYHYSRSIWPAVIAHVVNNAVVFGSAALLLG